MTSLNEFTDDEIREQLECLGFKNVSKDKFNQFKNDLEKLIAQEVSINSNTSHTDLYQNKLDKSDLNEFSPTQVLNQKYQNNNKKVVTFPDDSHLINDKEESDGNESDQSFASVITTESSIFDNKVLKRKIVRKTAAPKNNQETSNLINEYQHRENEFNEDAFCDENDQNNLEFEDDQDEQLMKLNDCYPLVQYPMKSFIRSKSSLSNTSYQNSLRSYYCKSNPVNRYHQYNELWKKQKVPGEKKHNDLRWSIREQMLTKDVIVKRQPKTYEPNVYIIPTNKKRQQLRWAVRNALANQF